MIRRRRTSSRGRAKAARERARRSAIRYCSWKHLKSDENGNHQQAVGRRHDIVPHHAKAVLEMTVEKGDGGRLDNIEESKYDESQQLSPETVDRKSTRLNS